jgi:hypothetical protein
VLKRLTSSPTKKEKKTNTKSSSPLTQLLLPSKLRLRNFGLMPKTLLLVPLLISKKREITMPQKPKEELKKTPSLTNVSKSSRIKLEPSPVVHHLEDYERVFI